MDLHVFVDIDRPVLGIEDDHGMDLGAAADEDVAAAAADGDGIFHLGRRVDAAASGGLKIRGRVVPGWPGSVPDVVPCRQPGLRCQGEIFFGREQQCVDGIGVEFRQVFADDRAASTSPSASRNTRLGPSSSLGRPSAFTRASTTRRSVPERLFRSLTGHVVWRRQTSAR